MQKLELVLHRCGLRLVRLSCAKMFSSWVTYTSRGKSLCRFAKCTCTRLLNRLILSALHRWQRSSLFVAQEELAVLKSRLSDVSRQLESHQLSALHFQSRIGVYALVLARAKFVAWSTLALSRVYFSWIAFMRARSTQRRCHEKRAHSWARERLLGSTFRLWANFYSQQFRLRLLMRRTILRIKNKSLSPAFETWKAFALASKCNEVARHHREQIAMRVLGRMMSIKKSRAFYTWSRKHAFGKKLVVTLCRSIFLKIERSKRHAFALWMLFSEAMRHEKRKVLQIAHSVDKFRRRLLYFTQARAFSGWRSKAADKKRFRMLAHRCLKRLSGCRIALAFNSWTSAVTQAQHQEQIQQLREQTIERCRRHLRYAMCGKALRGWQASVDYRKRMREKCKRIVARFCGDKRRLSQSIRTWWLNTLDARINENQQIQIHKAENLRQRFLDICHRHIQHSLTARSLSSWVNFSRTRQHARKMLRRATSRTTEARQTRAFRTWTQVIHAIKHDCESTRRCNVLVDRCRRRIRALLAASSLNLWKQFKVKRAAMRAAVNNVFTKWLAREVAKAMNMWSGVVRKLNRIDESNFYAESFVNLVRRRQSSGTLYRTFLAWNRYQLQQRYFRGSILHVVARMTRRTLATALMSWRNKYLRSKKFVRILEKVVARSNISVLLIAFGTWITFIVSHRRHDTVCVVRELSAQRASVYRPSETQLLGNVVGYTPCSSKGDVHFQEAALWKSLMAREHMRKFHSPDVKTKAPYLQVRLLSGIL